MARRPIGPPGHLVSIDRRRVEYAGLSGRMAVRTIARRTRLALIWLGYLGLACRMLVPAGYMPAPLGQGGPVILCHGGIAGEFFKSLRTERADADHHAHHGDASSGSHDVASHDDGSGQHEAWELCPIGSALAAVALTGEFALQTLELDEPAPAVEPAPFATTLLARAYWARAPPSILPA
jgi:hypothetical protein